MSVADSRISKIRTALFLGLAAVSIFGLIWFKSDYGKRYRCHQIRAGFDIGSGTTKMTVAQIDICERRILNVLEEAQEKVGYQEAIMADPESRMDDSIVEAGRTTLVKMAKRARELGGVRMQGYATAAFREAANGFEVAAFLSKDTGIPIRILSPKEEAEVGLAGVRLKLGTASNSADASPLAVWDIGGGSQEILAGSPPALFRGEIASVSFKNLVIQKIKSALPKKKSAAAEEPPQTPNPLNKMQIALALQEARVQAQHVPQDVRTALAIPQTQVIGIGGVHWFSVRPQTGAKSNYSQADLEATIRERTGWTDEKFKSKYAETELTNLILVLGFMQELGIDQVTPMNVNLATGALFRVITD